MKATITGINGFIGSALNKRLIDMGWKTSPVLQKDVDYVFLFGSPSSDHWFSHALGYSLKETIDNFISACEFCREHKIKLIYPSSATVYTPNTNYAKTKQILDTIASMYTNTLGLRIYAGYGPGEAHKGEYASIVYKFATGMKKGKRPVIWGTGKQSRDFIHIDDIITAIVNNIDKTGYIDIGSGVSYSFNEIVHMINSLLYTNILPIYKDKPELYVEETICKNPVNCDIELQEGIQSILQ